MDSVEIASNISAMKRQEQSYLSKDYLHSFPDETEYPCQFEGVLNTNSSVNEALRLRMVNWCYQIVAFCQFSRDTVAISTNYLDRFLSTTEGINARKDWKIFRLAAMTCLYTAIKIHEVEAIDPTFISNLSKGNFTEKQVVDMEQKIIMSLQWRLNPPTPSSFIQKFLSIIPDKTMSKSEKSAVRKLATYQTELSVGDYNFLSYDASCIALASLANAIQATRRGYFQHILQTISKIADIDISSQAFMKCRESLYTKMNMPSHCQESYSIPQLSTVRKHGRSTNSVHNSPRGVDTFPTR
eukprot:CAMPEP_0194173920 /NCGR_PEP_ID=MMETSP0154-20130528/8188_1 /TAXON_ID=1049557 /ORGANISM="Thalassiothrix antarctica, Strain L6-D1" /LENGTH=297 /DNA_ID=CAMNT_0038887169 /DNA_START=60 /DNA_END=953 /DNA_ORIENTATION=+